MYIEIAIACLAPRQTEHTDFTARPQASLCLLSSVCCTKNFSPSFLFPYEDQQHLLTGPAAKAKMGQAGR